METQREKMKIFRSISIYDLSDVDRASWKIFFG